MKTIVKIYIWIRILMRASKINEEVRAYRSHPCLSVFILDRIVSHTVARIHLDGLWLVHS